MAVTISELLAPKDAKLITRKVNPIYIGNVVKSNCFAGCIYVTKVQIFLEGHKILKKTPNFFEICTLKVMLKSLGDFFFKFCGLLRISELYYCYNKIVCN